MPAISPQPARDHGGGIDSAVAQFGGTRGHWVDLSTGINPVPYPIPPLARDAWTALPDAAAFAALTAAARRFWQVPDGAAILPAPGASALIAQIPGLLPGLAGVDIPGPTYNEHAAAFAAHGISVTSGAEARVVIHPNNPTGKIWQADALPPGPLTVIDESFCDVRPEASLIHLATRPGTVVLKSFGKFWGLAGLRLGFAIGDPALLARLSQTLGPWQVSGPALGIGAAALTDRAWASATRTRLTTDAARLDSAVTRAGGTSLGGTTLFRLYHVGDAAQWQSRLARHHIWSRIFPYDPHWLRLGLPGPDHWDRLETALR